MKAICLLMVIGLMSCSVYKGESPKKASEWYIYQIDVENDSMYTYFAQEIDPSFIKVQNTWFTAPAKSFRLFDTIGFGVVRKVRTKK